MDIELAAARSPVALEAISRDQVRQLVADDTAYSSQASAEGRNIHQIALDRQDQIDTYLATLSEDARSKFIALYEEEMNAATQAILAKTAELNATATAAQVQAIVQIGQVGTWISLIIFFVIVIGFILMNK